MDHMSTTKPYKDYVGSIDVDMERRVLHGKILFIRDLVTFEAKDPDGLQREFEAAVDDYLDTCLELGRDPMKPMSGSFNVRIDPSLHMAASTLAAKLGCSLNACVAQAIHSYVEAHRQDTPTITVDHQHSVTVTVRADETMVVGNVPPTSWEPIGRRSPHAH